MLVVRTLFDNVHVQYLAHGFYRDSFSFSWNNTGRTNTTSNNNNSPITTVVVKSLRYEHDVEPYNVKTINTEALIMERLTSSSFVTNIYGHCGTSIIVEKGSEFYKDVVPRRGEEPVRGRISQKELDKLQIHDVHPFNNYRTALVYFLC